MAVLSCLIKIMVFTGIMLLFLDQLLIGALSILAAILILKPFSFFYYTRQKADQSWIVYNTLTGQNITYKEAHSHTSLHKGKLRLVALVDILVAYTKSQNNSRKGILGILTTLFIGFLTEVWDLLSHYLLPSVVIEEKSIKEIVPEIKSLKSNVPATLTGVFGIDFVGNVVKKLFIGIYAIALLLSVGTGYLMAMFTQITIITIGEISLSWLPVVATLLIISIISAIYTTIVASIKVIYFTIFYTSIMKSD